MKFKDIFGNVAIVQRVSNGNGVIIIFNYRNAVPMVRVCDSLDSAKAYLKTQSAGTYKKIK